MLYLFLLNVTQFTRVPGEMGHIQYTHFYYLLIFINNLSYLFNY